MIEKLQQPNSENRIKKKYFHGYNSILTQELHAERTATIHAAFFLPFLRSGMKLLDCGCGSGGITIGLAEACAPGQAIGVDMGITEIERAIANANEKKCSNVRFKVANIYELPFPDETFDAVFSHAVLEHLNTPLKALDEMNRVLKIGGIIAVRDADLGSYLFCPSDPLLESAIEVYEEVWNGTGGNSRMARNLSVILRQAEFVEVTAYASAECWGTVESTKRFGQMMALRLKETDFVERAANLGVAEEAKLKQLSNSWRRWGNDPNSFSAIIWCEAVGWKK
jgi:ubiquinone/menaquinone biosynthesis C-methylase UbiE